MFKDQRDLFEKLFAGKEDYDLKMNVKLWEMEEISWPRK